MGNKIETQGQLRKEFYNICIQYIDCVIEIINDNEEKIYLTSTKISDNSLILSLCAKNKSVGDIVKTNDDISKWINKYTYFLECIDFNNVNININIKQNYIDNIDDEIYNDEEENIPYVENLDGYYDIIDYREDYLNKHNMMRILQKPLKIKTINQAEDLFFRFLKRDDCDKIIFSFYTNIPDLNHTFIIDLVIDKIYVYGRSLISFVITRPDLCDIEFIDNHDCIYELNERYEKNIEDILSYFDDKMINCFKRCSYVSNEEINISVYSNCNLNNLRKR